MPPAYLLTEHRGCKLAYTVQGDGAPVILIQGVGVHGDGWMPQVDQLAARYRCLTFDNRGLGRSQPIGFPLSVEQMAEDARVLMDAQGWGSAHVVGHSLGGSVALQLALTSPEKVRSLSLLCTFARGQDAAPLSLRMIWLGLRTQIGTRRMRRLAFLRLVMPTTTLSRSEQNVLAEELAPLFGHDLGIQPAIVEAQLKVLRRYDPSPDLVKLSGTPTLVVGAAHDPIAPPAVTRALAAAIPGARYIEIPEASHGVAIQQAERINALLMEHIDQTERENKFGWESSLRRLPDIAESEATVP